MEFQPIRAGILNGKPTVELQLTVRNPGPDSAGNIRVRPGLISASPDQDRVVEAFHAPVSTASAFEPFGLEPGEERALQMRLDMPPETVHIVTLTDRPMFVPIVLIDLSWRAGLSVKRMGADFMVGVASSQNDRLGPIWLDRGERMHEDITARIYRRAH